MPRIFAPVAVTAVAIALVTFGSLAASTVLGAVSSQGRYPESMPEYALPALGGAAELWGVRVVVFGIVVFGGFVLLFRRQPRTAGAVLGALAISVGAGLGVAIVVLIQVIGGIGSIDSQRALSHALAMAVGSVGTVFLTGTPMVVIGALLLRSWRASRGLTGGPDAL